MPLAHRRDHTLRAFRRSGTFDVVSSTPTPSIPAQRTVSGITPTTRTFSIIGAVLCAVVLVGVVFLWRLRVLKQKPIRNPTLESKISTEKNSYTYFGQEKIDLASSVHLEKPKAAYGTDSGSPDLDAGWAPQVTTYRGVQMTPKQLTAIKSSPKKYAKWEKALQLQVNLERSPPAYSVDVDPSKVPLPPTPPESTKRIPPTPPTPPATKKSRTLLPGPSPPLEPLPSPSRSTSFASQMNKSNQNPGKQMTVVNIFSPNMDDEIPITIGETVRLEEEYQDGWCLIQTLGEDSRRGVVPRFCLVEQPFSRSHRRLGSNYL